MKEGATSFVTFYTIPICSLVISFLQQSKLHLSSLHLVQHKDIHKILCGSTQTEEVQKMVASVSLSKDRWAKVTRCYRQKWHGR